MHELVGWIQEDSPDFNDGVDDATGELEKHGLVL
jgi:hypothetical protein